MAAAREMRVAAASQSYESKTGIFSGVWTQKKEVGPVR